MFGGHGGTPLKPQEEAPHRNGAVLLEAEKLINAERRGDYGDAQTSFRKIAAMWTTYLGYPVSPKDVAICMALLKVCRESNAHKHDNLVDMAGYIGLASEFV